jgi:hypothetical protein
MIFAPASTVTPGAWSRTQWSNLERSRAIGDLSLLGEYVFAHDHKAGWFVSALGGVKLPTGDTGQTAPDGERLETEHQPGTGSWDPLFGLAASKSWGPWALHGSAFYQLSTKGSQATELGDRLSVSTAVVHTFSAETRQHAHSGKGMEHHHHNRLTWGVMLETSYEREGKERIAGLIEDDTDAEGIWLSPGVRFASPGGWSAALSAGVPIWQDIGASHPDNSFRVIMQIGTRL